MRRTTGFGTAGSRRTRARSSRATAAEILRARPARSVQVSTPRTRYHEAAVELRVRQVLACRARAEGDGSVPLGDAHADPSPRERPCVEQRHLPPLLPRDGQRRARTTFDEQQDLDRLVAASRAPKRRVARFEEVALEVEEAERSREHRLRLPSGRKLAVDRALATTYRRRRLYDPKRTGPRTPAYERPPF